MSTVMHEWLVVGITFAGAPALALARRWDAVEAGETIPRACGPAPVETPEPGPEATPAPEPVAEPAYAPAYLRLGRVDDSVDADRRARRYQGMVRAGY
jgi:hypothetical protein